MHSSLSRPDPVSGRVAYDISLGRQAIFPPTPGPSPTLRDYVELLRARQWVKNLFVLSPLFFAGQITMLEKLLPLLLGTLAFSLVASSIYVLNDYRDMAVDRLHPAKCRRPLASGAIPVGHAFVLMGLCLALGAGLAWGVHTAFFGLLSLYILLNLGYSFGLKHLPILDLFIIAIGFVLRVLSGGVISGIPVSQWLIVMIFLLSLFLGLAKRRDDLLLHDASRIEVRHVIQYYNHAFLDACIVMVSGIIIVAYLMYTLSPPVMERLGSDHLYYTSLFVVAGIMRYLQLAYVYHDTGSPTDVLYKDRFIQLTIVLWVVSFAVIIYAPSLWII